MNNIIFECKVRRSASSTLVVLFLVLSILCVVLFYVSGNGRSSLSDMSDVFLWGAIVFACISILIKINSGIKMTVHREAGQSIQVEIHDSGNHRLLLTGPFQMIAGYKDIHIRRNISAPELYLFIKGSNNVQLLLKFDGGALVEVPYGWEKLSDNFTVDSAVYTCREIVAVQKAILENQNRNF